MENAVVTTKLGKVKGVVVELECGRKVEIFRNIPFAKPPTGTRRFMAPEPCEGWTGTLDCTKPGSMPLGIPGADDIMGKMYPHADQYHDLAKVYDENCLNLSVYTPAIKTEKRMAVMVWIYGGGFQMGSERGYDGTVLAGMNDVVVVIPNYRVGILGFFNLGPDSPCSGNAGLLDQQQALRWVQEHIEDFGGDRNNVTLFGQSAGAQCVHLHLSSPTAKRLVHKAISQSGQQQATEAFLKNDNVVQAKKVLLKLLKIQCESDNDILKEMQKLPVNKLLETNAALMAEKVYFTPTIDGKVIPKMPRDMLKNGEFFQVPYIIGFNNTEGDGLFPMMSPIGNFTKGFTEEQARLSHRRVILKDITFTSLPSYLIPLFLTLGIWLTYRINKTYADMHTVPFQKWNPTCTVTWDLSN